MTEALECTAAGRTPYDPTDYAEEWMFLTAMGVQSDQIIARSLPSRDWFTRRVLPLVTRSLCATCGDVFNPQRARSLIRCTPTCGISARVPAPDLIAR